ncbi:hypothetical protein [Dethiothermospora halolimnae]|uniref:hypothetical protein n=1 Tax=Dethiothermospora halolimnae TaxID=3114390 RepID=UPI003CCBFCA4
MKPGALEEYNKFDVEGITVYINNKIEMEDTIKVRMSEVVSDLPNKEIAVEGIM